MAEFKDNKEGKIDELKVRPLFTPLTSTTNVTLCHRKALQSRRPCCRSTMLF